MEHDRITRMCAVHLVQIMKVLHRGFELADTYEGRLANLDMVKGWILSRYSNAPDSQALLNSNPNLLTKLAKEALATDRLYDAILIMQNLASRIAKKN